MLHVPAIEHRDAIRQAHRFFLIVCHQNRRDTEVALQPLDLDLHVEAQVLIQGAERLVEEQDLRIDRQRTG